MSTRAPWPVSIEPHGGAPVVCGTVLWRAGGQTRLTVIVKASFAIVPEGAMSPVSPDPLVESDTPHLDDPHKSLIAASEIAPYLARCEVFVTGHAYAPPGRPQHAVELRLAVLRDGVRLLDKPLGARGDRPDPAAPPAAFQQMPLVYERATAHADWNPVGVAAGSRREPNFALPSGQEGIAGYGPIARWWPARQKLLGGIAASRVAGRTLDIPEGFDWAYLHAAPPDQRIDFLRGHELLVLGGLTPHITTARTQLPGVKGIAHLYGSRAGDETGVPIPLWADTLAIDSDKQVCTVLFRGNIEVDAQRVGALHVLAGIDLPGFALDLPERASQSSSSALEATPDPDVEAAWVGEPGPAMVAERAGFDDAIPTEEQTIAPFFMSGAAAALPFVHGTAHLPSIATPQAEPQKPLVQVGDDPTADGTMVGFRAPAAAALPFVSAPIAQPPVPPLPLPPPPLPAVVARPHVPMAVPLPPQMAAGMGSIPASWGEAQQGISSSVGDGEPPPPPAGAPPQFPARASEAIPVFGSTPLIVVTLPWQVRPPQDSLTVIVKGTFALVPDGPAEMLPETDPPIGDQHVDDDVDKSVIYPSDLAIFKPKADVTLMGHAVAPGNSSPAASVRFRFGGKRGFSRQIAVLGERRWQKTIVTLAPTDPKPFQRIRLTYENAFGGPGFDRNPCGVGLDGAYGPDGVPRLPSLEDPDHMITSPEDKPAPACFAPVPSMWKERWSKLGTYDARWQKTRWPYFPEDFDWAHFQSAPLSQQLDHLQGDEPFEVAGMHKAHPVLHGRLPGIRARCFFQRTDESGASFEEVVLRLDSVAFDIDAMKVNLVWRGVIEVSDEDAPEIAAFYAMTESLGEAQAPIAAVRERFFAALVPLEALEESPEGEPEIANEPEPVGDPEIAAMEAAEVSRRREIEAKTGGAAPSEPPPVDPEQVAATLRKAGVAEPEIARMIAALSDEEPPPPAPDPAIRDRVVALLREGAPLDDLDLEGADLSGLDFEGRSLVRASLRGANLRLTRFTRADLTEALLSGADLSEANLDGANLAMADLSEAELARASFAGTHVHGTDFGRARGEGAIFEGAGGEKTSFEGGVWSEARFDGASIGGADFTGTVLDRASFVRAEMPDIMLYDARGSDVSFEQASLVDARADGVSLPRAVFRKAHAPSSIWERAMLDEASFLGATLEGASFVRASCLGADFSGADLREATMRRTKLAKARLLKANMMGAILERADLTHADLRGSNLHGAETRNAKLEGAKLDLAIVTQTKLEGRT